MAIQLVVKHPLPPYEIGDHITDPETVKRLLASHPSHVTKKFLEEPAPAPAVPTE